MHCGGINMPYNYGKKPAKKKKGMTKSARKMTMKKPYKKKK